MNFTDLKVHIIGIGGIGVSALARLLKANGAIVSGSDIHRTNIIADLENEGITINVPHSKDSIKDQSLIIHSAIIKENNEELVQSRNLKKKILSRKEALIILLNKKKIFSICAAHGKSSTSAILASILPDFSVLVGAISKEFLSNFRIGQNDCMIFEADESDKSFLNSNPFKAIVINAEAEHLESYENDFSNLKNAYLDFINLSTHVVLNLGCDILKNLYNKLDLSKFKSVITLHPNDIKNVTYSLIENRPYTRFKLKDLGEFKLFGIGYHTAINASMAILSALDFLDIKSIKSNLLNYKGIKKRFDIIQDIDSNSPCIIDDYAHHPTEIIVTLESVRIYRDLLKKSCNDCKLYVIWQPHKYSRLRDNLSSFQTCFKDCDELIILPVYEAGEIAIEFDLKNFFKHYNCTFVDNIKRKDKNILLLNEHNECIKTLDNGIIIGLNAGDLTYKLRNY